jgi:hypothetical protein
MTEQEGPMFRFASLLVATTALVAVGDVAHGMLFCARKGTTGQIKEGSALHFRTACKSTEVALPISLEDAGQTVRFTGVDVQVVSGGGATNAVPNGRGNLIVGYNENDLVTPRPRTGSHNLIVGPLHEYTGVGGAALGNFNAIDGDYALATGGGGNHATGPGATAIGGTLNLAATSGAVVVGGSGNQATGLSTSVFGGLDNQASGTNAAVCGGRDNTAGGYTSVVSGGQLNAASADYSMTAGGGGSAATGVRSAVFGGDGNTASGPESTVAGGAVNKASGSDSAVSGGLLNEASGSFASVSGGNGVTQATADGWSAGSSGAAVSGSFSSP